jgi:hypothetical protein
LVLCYLLRSGRPAAIQQDGKTISGENTNEINAWKPIDDLAGGAFPVMSRSRPFAARPLDMFRIPD